MRVILDPLTYTVEQKPCLFCDKSKEKYIVYSINHNTMKDVKAPVRFTHYTRKMFQSISKNKYGNEINPDPTKGGTVTKNELFFCDEVCVNLFLLACMD